MTGPRAGGIGAAFYGNAYVLLALTTMMWGGNAIAGRMAIGEISPMALVLLRWAGVVVLMGFVSRKKVLAEWPVMRERIWFLLALGACGFTLFNGLFYVAAHSTVAINMGILQGAIPVFVLLGALTVYGTRVSLVQAGGVLLTMVGITLIASQGELERLAALQFNRGDLLMVGACALYAGYTVALRKRPNVSGIAMFTVMAGAAFVTALPLAAIEVYLGDFQWPTPKGWGIVLFVTLFPSFLAQIFFLRGVDLIGPGRAGVFVNLVPIFAAAFAVVILGEVFAWFHAAALVLVLGGIALANRTKS
ncbi:DMT family transporter [Nisaea acidiphila]|uniref:DMT family transporter n=1 Tax=Nisaea acidiphila TaxID=1862145 RepID=A0A9J7AW24_9PROT|nr:DMT family transporter [Nisaea acidiphila]UUX50649.1 DMT family transporter [Nisaea acidiphila]